MMFKAIAYLSTLVLRYDNATLSGATRYSSTKTLHGGDSSLSLDCQPFFCVALGAIVFEKLVVSS